MSDTEPRHFLIGMARRDYYNQFEARFAITATSEEVVEIVRQLNRSNNLMDGYSCGSLGTEYFYEAKGLVKNFHNKEEFDTHFDAEVQANLRYDAERKAWKNLGTGY